MVWEIPALSSPVNDRRDRHTTDIGLAVLKSYYTLKCEWVGHYFDRLNPMNTYYDLFLYPETGGINPLYVIDEAALESDLLALTVGDSDDTTDVWLWHFATGEVLYGDLPERHQDYDPAFTHLSVDDMYSDWDLSVDRDIGKKAWTLPEAARFIDTYHSNAYTGYRVLDSNGAIDHQTPYGEFDLDHNSGIATVNFGGNSFGPNIVRIGNPFNPDYLLYMPLEMYEAFANARPLFELCGGDMTWLDTWDGVKAEVNTSVHYFGGPINVASATIKPLFVNHPDYLPKYNHLGASPAGDYEFWKSPDDVWYLNGQPIFDRDTPSEELPFGTPNTDDLVVAGEIIYSLGAMMRFDMNTVLAATKIPFYPDDPLGDASIGRTLTDYLINGMSRPIIKTSHCLAGSSVEIHEYHDARIALADGGFTLNSSSLLWSWRPYIAPQSWFSGSIWGAFGGLACAVGGKFIQNGQVYEAEEIQDTVPPNPNSNSPFNNGTTSGNTSTTNNWPAAGAPYLVLNAWWSQRTRNISQTRTESFLDPAGGQLPPASPLLWELHNYTDVDNRVFVSAVAASGYSEIHSVYSEQKVFWEREITDHTLDIDGNKTFGPWTEVLNGETEIDESDDFSTTEESPRVCTTDPHSIIKTDVNDRLFSSNGGANVVHTGHDLNDSYTQYTNPPEPSWVIKDHSYQGLDIENTVFVGNNPANNTSLITNSLEIRKISDDTVTYSFGVGTPPYTDTIIGGSGTTTIDKGTFLYNYAPLPVVTEPHYLVELKTFTDSGGSNPVEENHGTVGAGSTFSLLYPTTPASGWIEEFSNRAPFMSIGRIPTTAPELQSVEMVDDYSLFVRSHENCIFDGRDSNRIQMGSSAELLHPPEIVGTGPMGHTSGRSLRGNTIGLDTDSAGNTWITFTPVIAGIDEVYITLTTGEIVRTMVIVTGADYITDFGDNRDTEHWLSHDNKKHAIRHDYQLDSDAYDFFEDTATTVKFRDTTPILPTGEYFQLTEYNKYPHWDLNTNGYVEYVLTKNHLLADGTNIDSVSNLGGNDKTEVVLTTTSGLPFCVALVGAGDVTMSPYYMLIDERGALYCPDEDNPVEWRLQTALIPEGFTHLLYIDAESQEKRITDVLDIQYTI